MLGASDHFETFKNWISVQITSDFECHKKHFCKSSAPNMYVFKLPWDHSYPQKQTRVSYDAPIISCSSNRELMLFFEISCSLRAISLTENFQHGNDYFYYCKMGTRLNLKWLEKFFGDRNHFKLKFSELQSF